MLKPGDILVFEAGNDWIGKSIAWLTDSNVSHAAMMLENEQMVEMGLSGISVSRVETVSDGRGAAVMRFTPEMSPGPLMSAAQKYIDKKTQYDLPSLVLLAGLIIYRRIRPTPKLVHVTDILIRQACKVLDHFIRRVFLKNPEKTMVCSQLVYQIYEDCGKDYHIQIQGGLLQSINRNDMASQEGIILADLAEEANALDANRALVEAPFEEALEDEAIAQALYEALNESTQSNELDMAVDLKEIGIHVKQFLDLIEDLLKKAEADIPIDALFITPSDLLDKAANLEQIAKIGIIRQ